MVLIRLGCALVSATIFTSFLSRLIFLFWSIRCSGFSDTGCDEEYIWLTEHTFSFQVFLASLWILVWAYLEIRVYTQSRLQRPRLLTHLRYGPIAVLFLSIAMVIYYDVMMIQYSRWQIVRYIHGNASPRQLPNLSLHNDYRGFCGNGSMANRAGLYRETAAAYLSDPDPSIRARALQASIYVSGLRVDVLKKAVADDDPVVREIADRYWPELSMAPDY